MWDFILTWSLFNLTLSSIPLLGLSYLVLKVGKSLWLSCASVLHPDVEFLKFVSVRTLLDTHRNQGIISVLLSVKGQAQPEAVRRYLQEVVRRRDKTGNLAFPRLRHCLVTRCGMYAWQRGKFDLDQNLTVAPNTYKGRNVTEYNIQEYVSDIISKYLPIGIPPWQVIIIPSSEDHHYILIKLHHVLLSEGLNIGDLLPLIPPTRQVTGQFTSKSPLVEVIQKPTSIPILKERLTEEFSNRWNEFISKYDPLEKPELLKSTPTFPQFIAITVISMVSLFKECKKGFRVINDDPLSRLKYIFITSKREAAKRQVNMQTFFLSILVSISPQNTAQVIFNNIWYFCCVFPVRICIVVYAELLAFYTCLTLKYCPYPHTVVGILYTYVPLIMRSLGECVYLLKIIFSAPKTILKDILLQKEAFQTVTLCGRKCIAWSEPVRLDLLKNTAKALGVSETEVLLCTVSSIISKYFTQTNQVIPDDLPVTIRNINSNYIFATGTNVRPEDAMSGILCINLPIIDPEKDTTALENLLDIKQKFNEALEKQGLSHLLTVAQTKFGLLTKFLPSTILSIYLKYLSRKYAVTVTEVTSRYPNVTQRTLWGQEVNSVIYWRPPQANTSISICFNEYAENIKLGVMCDAQLVPHHVVLTRNFPEHIDDLAKSAGIQKQ